MVVAWNLPYLSGLCGVRVYLLRTYVVLGYEIWTLFRIRTARDLGLCFCHMQVAFGPCFWLQTVMLLSTLLLQGTFYLLQSLNAQILALSSIHSLMAIGYPQ